MRVNYPNQVSAVLANVRLIEGKYSKQMQVMKEAGRYAVSLKRNVAGETLNYYGLEDHKIVEDYLTRVTGVSRAAIRHYLSLEYLDRKAAKVTPRGELIDKGLYKATSKNGILWELRKEFIDNAPNAWRQAMFEGGYSYLSGEEMKKQVNKRIRAGAVIPKQNYRKLYEEALMGR